MKHYFLKTTKPKKGFTLIELIIVIAIIGVLTALIMPNFMAGRIRARDSAKKTDARSVKQAIQMYYNDYQAYPDDASSNTDIDCDSGAGVSACGDSFTVSEATYMKQLPTSFRYYEDNANDGYLLQVTLENASDEDMINSRTTCAQECTNTGSACCNPSAGEAFYCVCPD